MGRDCVIAYKRISKIAKIKSKNSLEVNIQYHLNRTQEFGNGWLRSYGILKMSSSGGLEIIEHTSKNLGLGK